METDEESVRQRQPTNHLSEDLVANVHDIKSTLGESVLVSTFHMGRLGDISAAWLSLDTRRATTSASSASECTAVDLLEESAHRSASTCVQSLTARLKTVSQDVNRHAEFDALLAHFQVSMTAHPMTTLPHAIGCLQSGGHLILVEGHACAIGVYPPPGHSAPAAFEAALRSAVPMTWRNRKMLEGAMKAAPDLVRHCFSAEPFGDGAIWRYSNATNDQLLERIISTLIHNEHTDTKSALQVLSGPNALHEVNTVTEAIHALGDANALIVFETGRCAYAVSVEKWPQRSPEEPPNETVLIGPHRGFVEALGTNVAMLRQILHSPDLRWEKHVLGTKSRTEVAMFYICSSARGDMLETVRTRLQNLDVPHVLTTQVLLDGLTGWQGRLLPLMESTERPERVAASLIEGRVAIMVEGSPVALLAPAVFWNFIQTSSDYQIMPWAGTLLRVWTLVALVAATSLSGLFLAVATVNQDTLPTNLFISLAQVREGTPLPLAIEIIAIEFIVEMIREAGLRMPGPVGQLVSILGAVIIGQTAVVAGLLSAAAIAVVATEYIMSFVIPSFDLAYAARYARYFTILSGAFFGLWGVFWMLSFFITGMAALRSFNMPYLAPISPIDPVGLADTLYRSPLHTRRSSMWQHSPPPKSRRRGKSD